MKPKAKLDAFHGIIKIKIKNSENAFFLFCYSSYKISRWNHVSLHGGEIGSGILLVQILDRRTAVLGNIKKKMFSLYSNTGIQGRENLELKKNTRGFSVSMGNRERAVPDGQGGPKVPV